VEHWDVTPDLITVGKGITSGYAPLAGVLVHERITETVAAGSGPSLGGHTYAANPVACAVGVKVLDYLEEHDLFARVITMGSYLFERAEALKDLPLVGDIRGKGMLMGLELVADKETRTPYPVEMGVGKQVAERAFQKGLYLMVGSGWKDGLAGDYPCLAPPFVATEKEIDRMLDILAETLKEVHAAVAG
jgi:adenosylmethionine-8-amino-7-oxononanoate aminotransferase